MSDLRDRLQQALGSAYSIERELGGGGMSRVFVATEHALGRQVVVKAVRVDGGEGAGERFRREITTAAQLQHPHIVPVLTAGDAGGTPYFTMPYVAGDSLRARVAGRGPLDIGEATKILRDVAQALAFAHERGFVHRDIKPDNVLLADGAAVVTDFGVAKALSSATGAALDGMTAAGTTLGTPAYMAPEQVSADPVMDHRVDIYAWGCMAYELLTGGTPFGSRTPSQLFAAHLTEVPAPLAARRADVPPALATLVMRCLAKDPARRPQSAREMLAELDAIATTSGPRSGAAYPAQSRRVQVICGVAAAIVIATGIFIYRSGSSHGVTQAGSPVTGASPASSSIAVMPFVNTSGDPKDEYFSDGMTDELTHALTKLPGIHLAGRSSSFSFKGKTVPAQEIGRTLGVGAIIEASVRRSGDRIRVTAQLVSTQDGQVRWSDSFERAGTDVFAIQDEFTSAILTALKPMLGRTVQPTAISVDSRGTTDAEAYDLYLRGRYFWAQRGADELDSAIALFGKAVQRDPKFARGWSGLALAHVLRPNFNSRYAALPEFDSTEAAARKAIAIDSTLADAHLALAMSRVRRVDLPAAGAGFARARQLEPQNPTSHHWSAMYFGLINDTLQAEREIDLAVTLDPLSATTINSRGSLLLDRRHFSEALDFYRRTLTASTTFATKFSNSPRPLIWMGLADSSYRISLRRLGASTTRGRFGSFVFAAAASGHWVEARAMRDSIARTSSIEILDYDRGIAALTFGDRAKAAELLVRSFLREGTLGNVVYSTCDPIFDTVRDETVFVDFLQRHGISRCPFRSPWPISAPPAEKKR